MSNQGVLAIDIGGGTQDILLYHPGTPIENCVQLILPSPTVLAARAVAEATSAKKTVCLTGNLMGGGAVVKAVRRHLQAGLEVYATPLAAKTIFDDPIRVEKLGVRLVENCPPGAVTVRTADLDLSRLKRALAPYRIDLPRQIAIAVQDHGEQPGISNRLFRFQHLRRSLEKSGRLSDLVYHRNNLPQYLTRMAAVLRDAPGALVMDTVAAAFVGALEDPYVRQRAESAGGVLLNVGNQHTTAALYRQGSIWGLFEHHTSRMKPEGLLEWVKRFRKGDLTNEEVLESDGHGVFYRVGYPGGFDFLAVTGPRRGLAHLLEPYYAAPYGNMMLAGCFGLVAAGGFNNPK